MSVDNTIPVVGTWQIKSFMMLTLDTNEMSHPIGEDLAGYLQYSPGGHMIAFGGKANITPPAGPTYTDADCVEIYRNIMGYAGTYRVEGNKIIHHVVASWRPDWIGTDQIRYFEISGDKLTIKTAPVKSLTGKDIVGSLIFERVE